MYRTQLIFGGQPIMGRKKKQANNNPFSYEFWFGDPKKPTGTRSFKGDKGQKITQSKFDQKVEQRNGTKDRYPHTNHDPGNTHYSVKDGKGKRHFELKKNGKPDWSKEVNSKGQRRGKPNKHQGDSQKFFKNLW